MKKLILGFLLISSAAFAFSFSIDKPSFHIITDKGSGQEFSLTIKNNNDTAINLKAYALDWAYTEDKHAKTFLKPGSTKYSCANWIKLYDTEFSIAANSKREYKFKLETPGNARGGHQAVLFFETQVPGQKGTALNYGARIGTVIYQETKDETVVRLEIVDKKVSIVNNKLFYKVKVKNSGNAWNSATALLSLARNNEVVEQATLGPVNLLPEDSYEFSGNFDSAAGNLLITIEDAKENLYTEKVGQNNNKTEAVSANTQVETADPEEILVKSFESTFNNKTRTLEFNLVVQANDAQKVWPLVKIYQPTTKKNIYKRLKTLNFTERYLPADQEEKFSLAWPVGNTLPQGKYSLVLSIQANNGLITRTKELII